MATTYIARAHSRVKHSSADIAIVDALIIELRRARETMQEELQVIEFSGRGDDGCDDPDLMKIADLRRQQIARIDEVIGRAGEAA